MADDQDLKYTIRALQYAEDVLDGTIPACNWVKLAARRFLDDLEWQADDDFAFHYDAPSAERACSFIEHLPHTKGRWAARGEKLVLEPWQAFFVCNVFGWLRKGDGFRRFREALLFVPRKNGKSILAAAIGNYMLLADGEHGAEVYSGATTERQAWEVFKPARLMVKNSPRLKSSFGVSVNAKNLAVVSDGSLFEPIIGNPGDGASPSCGIVDEYHEHKDDTQYDTLQTGMGARDQPLMLVITTAGDNIAGPCYALQERAQAMLQGTRPSDEIFALIYGVDQDDDWQSEAALVKANPNYGVSVGRDFLIARQREAVMSVRKQAIFKTKHLNVWVQTREAYFNVEVFKKAADATATPEGFADWPCMLAIDLAEKRDLTSVVLLFQEPVETDPRYAVFSWHYCPADTVDLEYNDHYQEWREAGLLIETEGAVTDARIIKADVEELIEKFNPLEVVFDPWKSRQMAVELSEAGATCVEFRNSPSNMNEPMREMDALIMGGRLIHDGALPFSWMLGNVVDGGKRGSTDLHRPDKDKAENKIDGPVACIMALGRMLLDETDGPLVIGDGYVAG